LPIPPLGRGENLAKMGVSLTERKRGGGGEGISSHLSIGGMGKGGIEKCLMGGGGILTTTRKGKRGGKRDNWIDLTT